MSFRLLFIAGLLLVVPAFAGTNHAIIVSASRLDDLDLMATDVAADTTVIDRKTIERSGAAFVPELLQSEANMLMRSTSGNGNDGQLSMRGFGDNSQVRVLVLVDGHKINRPDMGGIEWQSIPVSNIEKIEVIRGGQNVLYGNHALSGVVKITTRRGGDVGLQLNGAIGSFGYRSGSASYGGTFGDTDYLVGMDSYASDGFRSNSASRATSANASFGWYANDTDTLTLRASFGDSYIELPGPLTYEQVQDDPTQSEHPGEFSEDQHGQATLLYETEREWGAARVNTGVSYRDRFSTLGSGNVLNDQLGISFAPRARFGSEESFWMAGVDLFHDSLDVENYLEESRDILKSWAEFSRITAAPYVFAQRTFSEKTILNGGVRYEYAGTDNLHTQYVENQLSPTIDTNRGPIPNPNYKNPPDIDLDESYDGLVEKHGWAAELSVSQQLTKPLSVWAGYDRVYRYPTLDETASYQGYPLSDPLNEDLDPERGNNFELGAKHDGREWLASLTGFYMTLDNEIAYVEYVDSVSGDLVNRNENVGATRRIGVETEVAWTRAWYGASTRWTFVDARFAKGENKGNTVPLVPWAYGVASAWVEPVEALRLTATYTYVSEQYEGNDVANASDKMDAYGLVGLRANIQISDYVGLYILVNNLFDKTYASTAYSGGYYPGSGRSFRMGLSLVF